MDCRRLLLAVVALCSTIAGGCNKSETSGPGTTTAGVAADVPNQPERVVQEFLEAVRTGNDARATQMLTETAQRETQKHDLVVAPPGSDTASFKIGEVEYVVKDEVAHVASQWTDTGEDGKPHSDEIIWALRRDNGAWRIAGMAAKLFPGEPPLLLDFEDPEDMIRKQQMAEAEMQRRANGQQAPPAANTARPPAQTGNVLRQ